MNKMRYVSGLAALVVVLATACTGSVEFSFGGQDPVEVAVELIEGTAMAQRLGVDPISGVTCDDPPNQAVGTVFACRGESAGQQIDFDVLFDDEDSIFAGPTNVVDPAGLERLENVAVEQLNSENGFQLPLEAMECGDGGVILDAEMQMLCALTEPDTGTVFDVLVTVTNTESGAFSLVVVGEAE